MLGPRSAVIVGWMWQVLPSTQKRRRQLRFTIREVTESSILLVVFRTQALHISWITLIHIEEPHVVDKWKYSNSTVEGD